MLTIENKNLHTHFGQFLVSSEPVRWLIYLSLRSGHRTVTRKPIFVFTKEGHDKRFSETAFMYICFSRFIV